MRFDYIYIYNIAFRNIPICYSHNHLNIYFCILSEERMQTYALEVIVL
jgi:hypothetical protein